ncbi:glycoside hydrolase family 3 N-terminal domain-containing protein [Paenibacillus sp. MMO-58]|uniref:glycoside hydrolase family 3 N-terminal domain-containing protein n=1 Tax=Paenibacillus sp. MMO-58 TaxID=3081290 RepID=UPI003018C745
MKRKIAVLATAAMIWSTLAGALPTLAADAPAGSVPAYFNKKLSVEARVDDLLGRMTLDEKVGQMVQAERASITPEEVQTYFIGSVLSGGGSFPNGKQSDSTRDNWAKMVDGYQDGALSTRLAIPILYGVDAVHGQNNIIGATMFPHNIGLGASRDTALVQQIGAAAAEEVKASGTNWAFAPTIANPQNAKWGRTYEGFGDDQTLVGDMGAAFIKGMQGTTAAQLASSSKAVATAKHFLGEGYTDNGVNQGNITTMTEQQVLDTSLSMYESAVKAGVRTVMASYNSIQGIKMHANQRLLTDKLKGSKQDGGLGFTGFVISDYNAVQQITKDWNGTAVSGLKDQIRVAVNAGVDMMMMPSDWKNTITNLKQLVQEGKISEDRLNDAVRRILRVKIESGLFEHPKTDPSLTDTFGSDAHKALARTAVSESLVLLKNDSVNGSPILSQLKDMDDIFVAGKSANDIGLQLGGWSITWQGSAGNITPGTTILKGIQDVPGKTVTYNQHGRGAAGHDVAIVVVGESPYAESNGDNLNDLKLTNDDLATLTNVKESNIPTIVVLVSGRPMIIGDQLNDWDGLVAAWLPGTEGAGIADVLFGSKDFTGKLPIRWPFYTESYKTIKPGESNLDDSQTLFGFGYGLAKDEATPALKPVPEKPNAVAAVAVPGKIEAEAFTAMSGIQTEKVSDGSDPGLDVGWTDPGDYLDYKINVPAAGVYPISVRYAVGAGTATGGKFLDGDGKAAGVLSVSNTGGYQNWQTATIDGVFRKAGVQTLRFQLTGGGINLNWFEIGEKTSEVPDEPVDGGGSNPGNTENLPVVQTGVVESWVTNERDSKNINWYYAPRWKDGDKKLEQQAPLDVTTVGAGTDQTTITLDPSKEYQSMVGMGSSVDESTIHNMMMMSDDKQKQLVRDLVDPASGAGMSLMRLTIGTADFTAQKFYTYDDMPAGQTDVNLEHFSIQKDIDYGIIKQIKSMQAVNPNLQFFASPWSPPGWMKTSGSMIRGSVKTEYLPVLADYYVKYIQAYQAQGITISAMTLQNEPLLEIDYPSTKMPWEQEAELARLLRTKLDAAGLNDVKLWIFDHNPGDTMAYPAKILESQDNRDAIDGTAFHDYGGDLAQMTALHNLYPDENVYLTERAVWGTEGADRIAQYFRNWARSYNSWVVMLDSDIKTHQWTGTPDPTMLVQDSSNRDSYWLTPEYYMLAQYSKFVKPGYTRIDSNYGSSDKVTNVAFLSPDKKTVVTVVINQTTAEQPIRIVSDGTQFSAAVPAKSVVTYRWNRADIAAIPGSIQAVDYAAAEGTYQADGSYLTGINEGDDTASASFEYNVRVTDAGSYYADLEYSGVPAEGAAYELQLDGQTIGRSGLKQATDAGHFAKARGIVDLTAGVHKLKLIVTGTQMDVNSLSFAKAAAAQTVPGLLQAESFADSSGVLVERAGSTGSQATAYSAGNNWTEYAVTAPATGDYKITYRYASANAEAQAAWDGAEVASLNGSTGVADWQLAAGTIHLEAGTQTIRLTGSDGLLIDWMVIGSTLIADPSQALNENSLGGSHVSVELFGDTFAAELTAEHWQVLGLDWLTVSEISRVDDTHAIATLAGEPADIDGDAAVALTAEASETTGGTAATSTVVPVHANNDAETVSVAGGTLPYGVNGQSITLSISGGKFKEAGLDQITLGGDAAASGVAVKSATFVNAQQVELVLAWNETPYYGDRTVTVNVPPAAYGDSSDGKTVIASFKMAGTANHAEPITIPGNIAISDYYQVSGVTAGQSLTGFDKGDWADFNLDVPADGTYIVALRVKYPNGGTNGIQILNAEGTALASINVPNMSGSTSVVGVRTAIDLNEGEQRIRILSGVGGFDIQQLSVEALTPAKADNNGLVKVEAENYTMADALVIQYGAQVNNLGYVSAGGTISYAVNVPETGNYSLKYQYATNQSGVSVSFHSDGALLATTSLPGTGGWGNYASASDIVHLEAGVHTVKLLDNGDGFNLDWFSLAKTDEVPVVISGRVDLPVISGSQSGTKQTIKLTAPTAGAAIHYTTDGSLPTASSKTYTGSFTVDDTAVIRVIAVKDGMKDSFAAYHLASEPITGGDNGNGNGNGNGNSNGNGSGSGTDTGNGSGNGSQPGGKVTIKAPAPVVNSSTGRAVSTLTQAALEDAVKQASAGSKLVSIEVPAASGQSSYEIVLPASYVTTGTTKLELVTPIGVITIPGNMVTGANGASTISIVITASTTSGFDAAIADQFANKPFIDLQVLVDGKPVVWSNLLAPVKVAIPYSPSATEKINVNAITVRYIDEQGTVTPVPSGHYDPASGTVIFTTTHFSKYAVAYVFKTFEDIAKYGWAKEAIESMASKGVITGITDTTFSPAKQVKRGDFVLLLVRALGLNAAAEGNFSDVKESAYYYDAIATAKALGIVQGKGGNLFEPEASITRQEMMTLAARALEAAHIQLQAGSGADLQVFTDGNAVAGYAKDAVGALVKNGIVTGSGSKIDPNGTATRAETAVIIDRMYRLQ